jgi:hypothetical protein
MTNRLMAALVATTAVLTIASGCGGSGGEASRSAAQIADDASRAAAAATSVHIAGTASAQGQQVPVDVRLSTAGAVGTGSFGGTTVQIVRIGDNIYVRGAQQVLGSFLGAAAARKIDDHWVQIPAAMPQLQQFAALTDLKQLPTQLFKPAGTVTKAGTRTVNGTKAIALKGYGSDGSATLVVATSGTPYPLQLISSGGTLTFSEWNAPVSVQKPSDVVPLTSLTG